jgi:abortive infection bacteriophage resistance protein
MQFTKPPLDVYKQIQLLEKRGLLIADKEFARQALSNINYYRLSAYMLPFQKSTSSNHEFKDNTVFEEITRLCAFDRALRVLVFDVIERVEVALRTQIIYQYAMTKGGYWFEDSSLYQNPDYFLKNMEKLDAEISRSNEVFIKHYKGKYTEPERPPAWMTLEISSMGLLSQTFKNLKKSNEKTAIGNHFGIDPRILASWMQSLAFVRNICAHHGRLWNRVLTHQPTLPNYTKNIWLSNIQFDNTRLYGFLSAMLYLLKTIDPQTTFSQDFKKLLSQFPEMTPFRLGFPNNWDTEPLWQ